MNSKKHFAISTILSILIPMILFVIFRDNLPEDVPIHWNSRGEVNRTMSKQFFTYGTPIFMGIVSVIGNSKYKNKFESNVKLAYAIPISCILVTFLMLYLAGAIS